jgi:hypothetical protein
MMAIDPIDDATFWFTTEYIQTTGSAPWKTRVASFTFGFDLDLKVFLEGPYSGSGQDGTSYLRFGLPPDDYYVVIHHRNHLDIMSSTPLTIQNNQIK